MGIFQKTFWQTLWQDKKVFIIAVLIVFFLALGYYGWFQLKRSWNWNIGGYESRAHDLICNMAKNDAIAKGSRFKQECE